MRFLANENLPLLAVEGLRRAGHDVGCVRTDDPGISDDEALARAVREDRVLLTFDKDFGALVFRRGARARRGIVLFRVPLTPPDDLAPFIVATIASRSDWEGYFSVVEPRRVRMRPLPAG